MVYVIGVAQYIVAIARTAANQLKFWCVADTKETTSLTADEHINRC